MSDIHNRILSVLSSEDSALKIKEIAARCGLDPHTAARNLDVLEVLGRVRKVEVGTAKKYHLIEAIPVSGLIDISSDLVIILNTKLKIQYVNQKAQKILDLMNKPVIGERLDLLQLDLFSHPKVISGLKTFTHDKVYREVIPYIRNGQESWYAISIIGISLSVNSQLIAIIAEDVTETRKIQAKLKENEEKLRSFTTNIPGITYRYTLTARKTEFFNDNLQKMTGYHEQEITTKDHVALHSLVIPEDVEGITASIASALLSGEGYSAQYRIRRKDGVCIHLQEQGSPYKGEDGGIRWIDGVIFDITPAKEIEEKNIRLEKRYHSLFKSVPVAICEDDFSQFRMYIEEMRRAGIVDFKEYFEQNPKEIRRCMGLVKNIGFNPELMRLFGFESKSTVKYKFPSLFTQKSQKTIQDLFVSLAEGKTSFKGELSLKSANGRNLHIIMYVSVMQEATPPLSRVLTTCYDDTSRKMAYDLLIKSEQKMADLQVRQIADATDDALFMHSGGQICEVNASAVRMFGYLEKELKGMSVLSLVTPKYREYVLEQLLKEDDGTYETEGLTKDGKIIRLMVRATTIRKKNKITRYSAVKDITIIREKEHELKASEEMFRSLVQNSPNAIILIDEQGLIIEWNTAAESFFGIPRKEAVGQEYCNILVSSMIPEHRTPERIERIFTIISEALTTGRSDSLKTPIEAEIITSDGVRRYIRQTVFFIPTETRFRLGSITMDITEQKENEKRLQASHLDLQAAYEEISATEEELRVNYEELAKKSEELKESKDLLTLKLNHILTPDYDVTEEELANIIDCEEIQRIMDDFYALSGIGIAIDDLNGKILVATGWQDICTKFHRVNPETEKNCLESDIILTSGVKPGEIKAYKCKNNLWDLVTPIMIGSRHVGNLFLGQFFYTDEQVDLDIFRKQAAMYGFNPDEYLAALDRVPRWSRETVTLVMDFYRRFAGLISRLSYSNLKLAKSLTDNEMILQDLAGSQEKYRRYCEFSPLGILVTDGTGNFVDVNPMACSVLGYSLDELMGMDLLSLFPAENRALADEYFFSLVRMGFISYETKMQKKNETAISVLINAVRLPDDTYMIFITELTERDKARKREASALGQIERNIYQLATLNDQIRNPLSVISTLCEMDNPVHFEQIQQQIMIIDQIIRKVDQGWIESVKIREYLHKHHGIILHQDD